MSAYNKRLGLILALALLTAAWLCPAADLPGLKVLYVGSTNGARAEQFRAFLATNVQQVVIAERVGFDPARAQAFDVVLLDWPQSGKTDRKSPLGPLKDWSTPTVLLGSASLQMAIVWDVKGGFG